MLTIAGTVEQHSKKLVPQQISEQLLCAQHQEYRDEMRYILVFPNLKELKVW